LLSLFLVLLFNMADEESGMAQVDAPKRRKKETAADDESKRKKRKVNLSEVTNKIRRQQLFKELKYEKNKAKREKRKKQRKDEDWESKKQVPKTTESMRIKDETLVDPEDEEVVQDELTDELSSYFKCERIPKVLLTTSSKPKSYETIKFIEDLSETIPNSQYYERKYMDIKKLVPKAIEREFTDIVVVNEDRKKANAVLICHLPDGPTAHFKLTNVKRARSIKLC